MANAGTITPKTANQASHSRAPVLITTTAKGPEELSRLLGALHDYDAMAEVLGIEQTDDPNELKLLVDVYRGPLGLLPLREATDSFDARVASAKSGDIQIKPTPAQPDAFASSHRLVVLGDPVTGAALSKLVGEVARFGGHLEGMRSLAHHPMTGLELQVSMDPCADADHAEFRSALIKAASDDGLGIAVKRNRAHPGAQRLVMFDVDATFIQDEVIEKLAVKAGVGAEVKQLTDAVLGNPKLDFAELLKQRVALLAGLDESALDEVAGSLTLTPGALATVRTLEEMGHRWGLASGGFTRIISRLMEKKGLKPSFIAANEFDIGADGKLTGQLTGEIVDRAAKRTVLQHYAGEFDIPLSRTVAVGDGANDIDAVEAADLGVAFCARPALREVADAVVLDRNLVSVVYAFGCTEADVKAAYPAYGSDRARTVGRVPEGHSIHLAHPTHHSAVLSPDGDHRPVGGPGRAGGSGRPGGRPTPRGHGDRTQRKRHL